LLLLILLGLNNATGCTSGARTAYPSGALELTPVLVEFMLLNLSLFSVLQVILGPPAGFFMLWPLNRLSFSKVRFLILYLQASSHSRLFWGAFSNSKSESCFRIWIPIPRFIINVKIMNLESSESKIEHDPIWNKDGVLWNYNGRNNTSMWHL
jgi:hypothetical protein